MADLPAQNIDIVITPRSGPEPDANILSRITFPAQIIVDDRTGGFRLNINVNGEPRTIAKMDGLVGRDFRDKIIVENIFGLYTGYDALLEHLEETDNLGDLSTIPESNSRKEYLSTGLNYGDSTQGLLLAKESAKKIFEEGAQKKDIEKVAEASKGSYADLASDDLEDTSQEPSENGGPGAQDPEEALPEIDLNKLAADLDINQSIGISPEGGLPLQKIPLYYPSDLKELKQDYIKFKSYRYTPQQIRGFTFESFDTTEENKEGPTVYLPTNGNIQDTNTVSWSANNINPIQIAGFKLARDLINKPAQEAGRDFISAGKQLIEQEGENIKRAVSTYFAQQAVGVTGLLSRTQGAILNPNLALLFNNPELRSFSFNFMLSARDETEATMIRKIIRFFKQTMAVRTSASNLFLVAPNIYKISYHNGGNDVDPHKSIGQIKTCALTSCNVNYVPDGSYMTFDDESRTMTAYQITLSFGELEPVYHKDYRDSDDVIGY